MGNHTSVRSRGRAGHTNGSSGGLTSAHPLPWPTTEAAFNRMTVDDAQSRAAGWSVLVARDGHRLAPDDPIIVYTARSSTGAARMLSQGWDSASKPTNLARERFERGEDAEAGAGKGAGAGLYVGITPQEVSGYGSHVLAIRATVRDITASPEQMALGTARVPMTAAGALLRNDAMLEGAVHPRNIRAIGQPRRITFYGTEWNALQHPAF